MEYTFENIKKLTFNQVKTYYDYGLIEDDVYWKYYHEWLNGSFKFGNHPVCQCEKCRKNINSEQ